MLARKAYRSEHLCHLCGMPKEVCRSRATEGKVSVDFERCHVTNALALKQRTNQTEKISTPESLAYSASVQR